MSLRAAATLTAAAFCLSSCGVFAGDPLPPPVALRSDDGVITVVVQTCVGPIEGIHVTKIDRKSDRPVGHPVYSASITGEHYLVILKPSMPGSSGNYDAKTDLLVEVVTSMAAPVGVWRGSTATSMPPEAGTGLVEQNSVSLREFNRRCQASPS